MFNKNFLVSLKGNEVMSIRQIDNKNKDNSIRQLELSSFRQ